MTKKENVVQTATTVFPNGNYQLISLDRLKSFKSSPFKVHAGKELAPLVESIKTNGLIHPIVVRPTKGGDNYEILSGNNRVAAAKQLGWDEMPAMVRDLDNDEAVIFVNEANISQRRFENWLPSEKAKSIFQYHGTVKKQGSRTSKESGTSGDISQKSKDYAREKTARVYGITGSTVRLYLSIYDLDDKLKDRLDKEEFGTTPAQALSRISPVGQMLVNTVLEEDGDSCVITVANAREVREVLKGYTGKDIVEETQAKDEILRILTNKSGSLSSESSQEIKTLKIEIGVYEHLFGNLPEENAVAEVIAAMEFYQNGRDDELSKNDENAVTVEIATGTMNTDNN